MGRDRNAAALEDLAALALGSGQHAISQGNDAACKQQRDQAAPKWSQWTPERDQRCRNKGEDGTAKKPQRRKRRGGDVSWQVCRVERRFGEQRVRGALQSTHGNNPNDHHNKTVGIQGHYHQSNRHQDEDAQDGWYESEMSEQQSRQQQGEHGEHATPAEKDGPNRQGGVVGAGCFCRAGQSVRSIGQETNDGEVKTERG